jgi:hypothetical protein
MEWQPIETAPRDKPMKLLTNGEVVFVGCWVDWSEWSGHTSGWTQYRCITGRGYNTAMPADRWPMAVVPTHWMPLPELPKNS